MGDDDTRDQQARNGIAALDKRMSHVEAALSRVHADWEEHRTESREQSKKLCDEMRRMSDRVSGVEQSMVKQESIREARVAAHDDHWRSIKIWVMGIGIIVTLVVSVIQVALGSGAL